jgi:hypothetical protein
MKVCVECYSGGRADERPRAVVVGDRRRAVAEVLDTWYGEDHLYFKVRLETGDEYLVRRDADGEWTLEAFRAAPGR